VEGRLKLANPTILLVDDEETDRNVVRQILQTKGFRVLEADTYQRALSVFAENDDSIDLLLTDISLPGGNGCELWVSMRKRKTDLKVLFVSGHVGAEVCRFYGLQQSDFHFLGKPFKATYLLARVIQVLRSPKYPKLHDAYWDWKSRGNEESAGNSNSDAEK
jgi:DNA-binding response OmpR family regulator